MAEQNKMDVIGKKIVDVAHDVVNSDAVRTAKEKIGQVADSEQVRNAQNRVKQEFLACRSWVKANWTAGAYGKFRVVLAAVIVLLAVRGLFCGWSSGTSEALEIAKMQKETAETEAGMAFLGALLGGGSSSGYTPNTSQSSGPKKHTWMCKQCGNTVESATPPPRPQCRAWHGQNDGSCYKQCTWRQTY